MKHTIRGRHGHLYRLDMTKSEAPRRVCISASEASRSELMTGELELRMRISKRYHTCWTCHAPTERAGGYGDPGCKKVAFFECDSCYPHKTR